MKSLILAIQFLTVFPVKSDRAVTKEALAGSMAWFPLVGGLQGAVIAGVDYGLSGLLPVSVRAGVALLVLALTNGGLHIDGFADTVDGLAGGRAPEERLRIMKDSAVGAVGAVFLVLLIIIQYSCISELPASSRLAVLFLFPAAGRWSQVLLSVWSDYARPEGGLGAAFCRVGLGTFAFATALVAVPCVFLLGIQSLCILAAIAVVTYLVSIFFKKRLGGVTGDVFGFQSETSEALFLIFFLAMTKLV